MGLFVVCGTASLYPRGDGEGARRRWKALEASAGRRRARAAPGALHRESALGGLEAVCDAARPALAVVEGAVAPCVQPMGALMLPLLLAKTYDSI